MLSADALLERMKLKRAASLWRALFFILIALFIIFIIGAKTKLGHNQKAYIARITLDDDIVQNAYESSRLQALAKSDNIKAIILTINSPGGTAFAGEDLYSYIQQIAQKKPVVTVIKTIATSAAYMVASPSHHIIARNNSLTGSIGAVVFSPDASQLLDKIGIKINTIKKGSLKAEPLPYKQIDETTKEMLLSIIDDNFETFINTILKHRKLTQGSLKEISSSRVFTGKQAKNIGLVDEIGGEEEAIEWLKNTKKLENLPIKNFALKTPDTPLKSFLNKQILSTAKELLYNNLYSYVTMYK